MFFGEKGYVLLIQRAMFFAKKGYVFSKKGLCFSRQKSVSDFLEKSFEGQPKMLGILLSLALNRFAILHS